MIIGLTHTDCPGAWSKEDVAIALGFANQKKQPHIVTINPKEKTSVARSLITLVHQFTSKVPARPRQQKVLAA
jgi:signal recognition particle receptor subunit beta